MKKRYLHLLLLVCVLLWPMSGRAGVTELVMPGPLLEQHAKFESDCQRCHGLLQEISQRELCLRCHKLIAADLQQGTGFHGKNRAVGNSECRDCHTDHDGRTADILLLDEETFDHANTDFALQGRHRKVACSKCHNPRLLKPGVQETPEWQQNARLKHRYAPVNCVDCHQQVEPHKGQLGKDCQQCHQPEGWKPAKFSHNKTKFQLEGAHRQLSCQQCHPAQRWKETPTKCFSCHRLNDNHGGSYGENCGECHSPKGATRGQRGQPQSAWKTIRFEHDKTKFKLRGKHRKVVCRLCHTGPLKTEKPPQQCVACHKNDAPHRDSFGDKCQDCHQTKDWKKVKHDHNKTKFPLQGKHAKLACDKCHSGPAGQKKLPLDCFSCHQLDDPHRGKQGQDCAYCHNPQGWQQQVQFEHDLTRFPLIGMHAVAPCEACHLDGAFKGTALECVACHQQDDPHKQRMGTECATCHNPNGWNLWLFDHNTQSKFKLDGKHQNLTCFECHTRAEKGKVSTGKTCASCHRKDDPHQGSFGRNCERCHTTEGFDQLKMTR